MHEAKLGSVHLFSDSAAKTISVFTSNFLVEEHLQDILVCVFNYWYYSQNVT